MAADLSLPVWRARREAAPKDASLPRADHAMRGLKAALIVLLAGAVAISGSLSYTLGHNAEVRSLWRAFDAAAAATQRTLQTQLNLKVLAVEMGAKFIATLPDASGGGGTFEPGFQAFGEDLLTITQSESLNWAVVVADEQRAAFEASAVRAAQVEDPSGALAAQATLGIRELNASTGQFHAAARAPLYVVRWLTSPRSDPTLQINRLQNLYSDAFRGPPLERALRTNQTVMTPLAPGLFKDRTTKNQSPPSSLVFAPTWVYTNGSSYGVPHAASGNGTGRAFCSNGFHWTDVLARSVPQSISSALIVLRGPDNGTHTFVWDGNAVSDGGDGDRSVGLLPRRLHRRSYAFTSHVTGSDWHVTLYPTPALERQFVSNAPRNTALAVIAASLACVLLFSIYEFLVRRRAQMMNSALRQNLVELRQMKQDVEDGCAREAQAQAAALAEKAGIKIKEQFVAMVSHEIRTPLNAMSGAAALLAGTSPLNDEQRSLLELLDAGADNVIAIIDDILQASALSSGNFPVLREPLALRRDVIEPAWRMIMLQPARRHKLERLRLSHHVADDVPDAIIGDATRLVQVITNLLSNSAKFTPEGGSIELRVDVAAAPAGDAHAARWLRFHIADTGIGIEPGNMRKIFQPFVQAESSTVREYGGTGLGLTICQRIASAMNGTLSAESEGLHRGTTFTFAIPLLEQASPPSSPDSPLALDGARVRPSPSPSPRPSSASETPSRPLRVLVAEDDLLCAAVMRKILERLLVAGTIVGDGVAAVSAYTNADPPFDIILLDLHMPLMDGLTASRAIVEVARSTGRRPTPVVALTASCGDDEKQRCAAAGMVGHVAKPVKLEVLQALFLKYGGGEG